MSVLNSFKPTDLYAILYDIADSMPIVLDGNGSEITCARLQTVAVVKDYASEVKTANLGKDSRYIGKKIAFLRLSNTDPQAVNGLKFNYPAFFLGEQDENYNIDGSQYNINYSLAISDRCEQAQGDEFNQSYCQMRTYEEVIQGLRDMWQKILKTLNDYVYADLYLGATLVASGWFSQAGIAELITLNTIDRYDEIAYLSQYIGNMSEARTAFDLHTENTVSYFIQLNVSFFNCVTPIAARPQDMVIIPVIPNDPDAQALFDAIIAQGGTVSPTEEEAANTAIIALKDADLWDDAYAFYFMLGGNAPSHALNAKAPTGLSADFSLTFFGGWVHSSTGALPNGVNTYADTYFIPSVNATPNSIAIGYYSGTNTAGSYIEMGVTGVGGNSGLGQLYIAPNLAGARFLAVNTTGNAGGAAITPTGMFVTSRNDGVTIRLHRNAALVASNAGLPVSASDKKVYVGGRNVNAISFTPTNRECRAAFISKGLSEAQANTISQIFMDFETAVGRNV